MKTNQFSIQQTFGYLMFLSLLALTMPSCDAEAKGDKYLVNIDKTA